MIEYADTYIGECNHCDRPASVRVHGDWMLCALHHELYAISEEEDNLHDASGLLKVWRSQAERDRAEMLLPTLNRELDGIALRLIELDERRIVLDRIDEESLANHERRRIPVRDYPTHFACVLSRLAHYEGDDWRRFAADLVETDEAREWLYRELTDTHEGEWVKPPPPEGLMEGVASALSLDGHQRTKLAMAYTFGK